MFHTPAHKQTDPAKQPGQVRDRQASIDAVHATVAAGGHVSLVTPEPAVQPCPNGPVDYSTSRKARLSTLLNGGWRHR